MATHSQQPPPPNSDALDDTLTTAPRRAKLRSLASTRLTLYGRCLALLFGEIVANLLVWVIALALFAPDTATRSLLSLCLVAWVLGLKHGLDMDHIVAIDNVTRNLVSMGQLPVTCGLFFSLGHSSIVIAATVAIIITVSAVDHLPELGEIGGVVGVAISASFLLALAIINSVVLYNAIQLHKKRRQAATIRSSSPSRTSDERSPLLANTDEEHGSSPNAKDDLIPGLPATSCLARVGRPLFRLIDRPWKMYPVGVLFGFGFDTASSISLLGVAALAGSSSHQIPRIQILVLPLLFTAGMTLIDSLDSVFMLHCYAVPGSSTDSWWSRGRIFESPDDDKEVTEEDEEQARDERMVGVDREKLLGVSVVLTALSITVAVLISVAEFMGLALEKCERCSDAAENDPGFTGSWWRFWAAVNDKSGLIGPAIVGLFVIIFGSWALSTFLHGRGAEEEREAARSTATEQAV